MSRFSWIRSVLKQSIPARDSRGGRPRPIRRLALEELENRSLLSVFTVLNTLDAGAGSLRQAITDANARIGADVVQFQLPDPGVNTIHLASALPAVTDPLNIDGTSQPGYAGQPLVELDGSSVAGSGLALLARSCRVTGLTIGGFSGYGIYMEGQGRNVIQGNYIGTDASGTLAHGNRLGGILITAACSDNIIGTNGDGVNDALEGNVISANGYWTPSLRVTLAGIRIEESHRNVIAGNLIGTDVTGTSRLINRSAGIVLVQGSQANRIGTNGNGVSDDLERNVITGLITGINLQDFGTTGTIIAGNYIGVDATGSQAIGAGTGVWVGIGADATRIGTNANGVGDAAERNVISGNADAGIRLESFNNVVAGNYIGTDASGTLPRGNGVAILDAGENDRIGGTKAAARNVISGNGDGVWLGGFNAMVQGNYIGTDVTGTQALGNGTYGISASNSTNTQIGGRSAAARNVISGNTQGGISLLYAYGTNVIEGNYIGVDATGTVALGNGGYGVSVEGYSSATIGGNVAGARNLISGNDTGGILAGFLVDGVVVTGNYIGTDKTGKVALGNNGAGILVTDYASNTQIGGPVAALRNVVSGNQVGIEVTNLAMGTQIQGNYIGTDNTGKVALGNATHGVRLSGGANGTVVGAPGTAANIIAFNGGAGVAVIDAATVNHSIRGNSIFSNGGLGIDLGDDGVTPNQPGGTTPGPNDLLSYPDLMAAFSGASTRITGSLNGPANAVITLDFYASPAADPTGFGEGKRYLGSVTVTTDALGVAIFDVTLVVRTSRGEWITATATDALGNTSEFSRAVRA